MGRKLRKDRSETLGFLLQRERKCQHITQEEMAKILGVTQERVSEIESGKRAGCFVIARHDPKYSYDQSRADMLVDDYRDLINGDIL